MILNVKKDITTIKEEVALGKDRKEVITVAAGMLVSAISVLLMIFAFKMPIEISIYLGIFISSPIYILAFVKLHGLNVFVLLRRMLGFHMGSQTTYFYVGMDEENLKEEAAQTFSKKSKLSQSHKIIIGCLIFGSVLLCLIVALAIIKKHGNAKKAMGISGSIVYEVQRPTSLTDDYQVPKPQKGEITGFLSWRVVSKADKSYINDTNWVIMEWSTQSKKYVPMWPQPKTVFLADEKPGYGIKWKGSLATDWLVSTPSNGGWFKVVWYQGKKEVLSYEATIKKDSSSAKIFTTKDGKRVALAKKDLLTEAAVGQKEAVKEAEKKKQNFAKENINMTVHIKNKNGKYALGEIEIAMDADFESSTTVSVNGTEGYHATFSRVSEASAEQNTRYIRLKSLMGKAIKNGEVKKVVMAADSKQIEVIFDVDLKDEGLQEKTIQE